ncbi:MAG: 50S ribosomal protein L11 methyltransferase [Desulfomonilaceae bacterium]
MTSKVWNIPPMLCPDSPLFIYEFEGELAGRLSNPPSTFLGLWNEEGFSYLFFAGKEDEYAAEQSRITGVPLATRHEMTYRDWQTGIPTAGICLGGVMIVRADHPNPPRDAILLDPSVVFGDGDHPTTRACLEYFHEIHATERVVDVLDLGTGTGILGLAAARLGASRVVAVDRNILAAQTAQRNVVINGLQRVMRVFLGEARHYISASFDVVFANLPFSVLRDLFIARGLARQRRWIISGIDEPQARVLQGILREMDYVITDERLDRPWVTFVAAISP